MIPKNTIWLWYDGATLDTAASYAATYSNSAVGTTIARIGTRG